MIHALSSFQHLQDWELSPYPGADLTEDPGAERAVHVPKDAQLVEQRRRAAPAQRVVAPDLLSRQAALFYRADLGLQTVGTQRQADSNR
jgi:hypothetical protein